METLAPRFTLGSLAKLLGGEADGPLDKVLEHPAAAGDHDPLGVTFAENDKYLKLAESAEVGAIIVGRDVTGSERALIRVESPRQAFGHLLAICRREQSFAPGIHPTAVIDPSAQVDPSASIGPYVVVSQEAKIGPKVRLFPFCFVGDRCVLQEGVTLYPHVVLYQDVSIGKLTVIHSGTVLGAEGFGYVWDGKKRTKIPQVGAVEIGHDAEIGANVTVDRATAGATRVGHGTKIDNLVQIAHNVVIGEHCVIAAQSGISGSTSLGDRVVMGGNVGTNDHINIGSDVILGGRSSVDRDIDEPGAYFGTPARPLAEAKRAFLIATKLPDLLSRIRELERQVEELAKE
jgi:UDP-3-O-[3-hydroxymyristoyl] glucosamine N-acyltransferase